MLSALTFSACSSVPPEQRAESDPLESMNRGLYSANTAIDNVSTKPLAKAYRKVIPAPARQGISNFFQNLLAPRSVINNLLQGKPKDSLTELSRFIVNSTIGVGGIFDIATASGLPERREDFGQTAAVWGVPDGPYVMLPLLGPKTLRDALLTPADIFANPMQHYENTSVRDKLQVIRIIDIRYRLFPAEKLLEDSKDPYLTTRESYLQNREFEVFDGNPPEEDDEFFDEFLEED